MTKRWAQYKEAILYYYTKQRHPLVKVIQIMASQHGFSASQRAYRQQFQAWGVFKYNRKDRRLSDQPRYVCSSTDATESTHRFTSSPHNLGSAEYYHADTPRTYGHARHAHSPASSGTYSSAPVSPMYPAVTHSPSGLSKLPVPPTPTYTTYGTTATILPRPTPNVADHHMPGYPYHDNTTNDNTTNDRASEAQAQPASAAYSYDGDRYLRDDCTCAAYTRSTDTHPRTPHGSLSSTASSAAEASSQTLVGASSVMYAYATPPASQPSWTV